jgi:hypothetical protein
MIRKRMLALLLSLGLSDNLSEIKYAVNSLNNMV